MIACYSRVSTSEQAKEGYSIGEQHERLTAYCKSRGWSDFKHFTDGGFSGGNMKRPALQDMIKAIKDGTVSKVIVYKLDRLSRSQKDTLELLEDIFLPNNVDFISMCENFDTSSPFGKAMIGMFSVFAQLEREQIRERVTIGREARAKEGKWHGGSIPPVGYDYKDGHLVVNEFEAMQIREIFKLFQQGYTYTQIAEILTEKGWSHRYGLWSCNRVRKVLSSPVYMGIVTFKGIESQGVHDAIIDRETFERVAMMIPKRSKAVSQDYSTYLTGRIYCGRCGARFTHTTSRSGHRKDGKMLSYYSCHNRSYYKREHLKKPCDNDRFRAEELEKVIFDELRKLTIEDVKVYRKQTDHSQSFKKELSKLTKQRSRLIDLYSLGTIDREELSAKIEPLTHAIQALESQISDQRPLDDVGLLITSISDVLDHGDSVTIKHLVDALIDKIVIDGEDITIYWNFD